MKLKNSYIFLENLYAIKENKRTTLKDGTMILSKSRNVHFYIKELFPSMNIVDDIGIFYKKRYIGTWEFGDIICNVEFVVTEVTDTIYLDLLVKGKTKNQIVKCIEEIQNKLLTSGIREEYIDIISYDSVSEYYCNKIYPKLNSLERNLRKLLLNIYTVNFGIDYYKTTIDEELQSKIKAVVGKDTKKSNKQIKSDYKTNTSNEAEEIARLQRFFYSFEYNDIQNLLFTPRWTGIDEINKSNFLKEHTDLSQLTDEELRKAFSDYVPKSDWERFFSNKITLNNISDMIDTIRVHRNTVAHFKFFYKKDYDECNILINNLNTAIIEAIKITEDKDFTDKNAEILSEALKSVLAKLDEFTKVFMEKAQSKLTTIIVPAVDMISRAVQESNLVKSLGELAIENVFANEEQITQKLYKKVSLDNISNLAITEISLDKK